MNENITDTTLPPGLLNDATLAEVSSAAVAHFHSYYRGQAFVAEIGVNPLVTASSTLFSLASKLIDTPDYSDLANLHEHLVHEIKAFEGHAQSFGCRSEIVLVGRYVLCAFFDEIILNASWGSEANWGKYKLLHYFQREQSADDRFFNILQRLSEDANIYIDILELMYITLSLGFMGKYRRLDNGKLQHQILLTTLYQTIRQQRGELVKSLTMIKGNTREFSPASQLASSPPWKILMLGIILAGSIFSGATFLFGVTTDGLNKDLTQIVNQASRT